ncbi:MAG: CHAD domain-containing protein [Lacibacter sp.]
MNLLKEFTLKQTDTAVHLLNEYLKTNDGEALHQLRVSIKKIRSVIRYFESQQLHEKKIKQLKKQLRHVFQSAGFIREAQLQIQWLKRNRYRILLKESLLETDVTFYEQVFLDEADKSRKILTSIRKELNQFCKESDEASVYNYAENLKLTIFFQLKSVKMAEWHELRKMIKQLLYAQNWLSEKDKIKLLPVKQPAYLDHLQEAIGNWHDAEDLKTWLSDEQFFLRTESNIKLQFNRCWELQLKEIAEKERVIIKLLKDSPA